MDRNASRYVTVNLTDAEWRALCAVMPDPCGWIKSQIRQLLEESGLSPVRDEKESGVEDWVMLTSASL